MTTEMKESKELQAAQVSVSENKKKPDYEGEIVTVIRGKLSPRAMQSRLEDYHGNDIAQSMSLLNPAERKGLGG